MLLSSRTLAGARVLLTSIVFSTFVACVSADPAAPTDVLKSGRSGVCEPPWNSTASMAHDRYNATGTALAGGGMLVVGGTWDDGLGNGGYVAEAERYNETTNTWSPAGTLHYPRDWHRAVRLTNGKVLVTGGITESGETATAELYTPGTGTGPGTWSDTGSMSTARWAHTLTLLSNGNVLAAGGRGYGNSVLDSAEIYDTGTGKWTPLTATMKSPRYNAAAALLPGDRVLVAGGDNSIDPFNDPNYLRLSSAEVFDLANKNWTATAKPMAAPRFAFGAATLKDGRVLVTGNDANAEIFTLPAGAAISSGTWSPTGGPVSSTPRIYAQMIPFADGRVMVVGGIGSSGWLDSGEIYDPALDTWTQINGMTASRSQAAAVELFETQPDGTHRILIAGGQTSTSDGLVKTIANAETYQPCPPNLPPKAVCKADVLVPATRTTPAITGVHVSTPSNACNATVSVDNGSYDPDKGPTDPLMLSQVAPGPYGLGFTPVTLWADDGQLQDSCTATVQVTDDTKPLVECPPPQTLECDNGGAIGTYFAQSATDNCSVTSVTCPGSGTTKLPMGDNIVKCIATDGSGNKGECSFHVKVEDHLPPDTSAGSKGMTLWPVDGLLHEITLMDCAAFVVDQCRGRLSPLKDYGVITYVTSDEGNTNLSLPDIDVKKPWLALVRAERNTGPNTNGRVYTIHYLAKDLDNNYAAGSCTVGVPKSQGGVAVDDTSSGAGYCFPYSGAPAGSPTCP